MLNIPLSSTYTNGQSNLNSSASSLFENLKASPSLKGYAFPNIPYKKNVDVYSKNESELSEMIRRLFVYSYGSVSREN